MIYKSMKNLCRVLATYDAQDRLNGIRGHKAIFRQDDFTPDEMKDLNAAANRLRELLAECSGKPWRDVLPQVRTVLPDIRLGFRVQDEIIETCRHNKIIFL